MVLVLDADLDVDPGAALDAAPDVVADEDDHVLHHLVSEPDVELDEAPDAASDVVADADDHVLRHLGEGNHHRRVRRHLVWGSRHLRDDHRRHQVYRLLRHVRHHRARPSRIRCSLHRANWTACCL